MDMRLPSSLPPLPLRFEGTGHQPLELEFSNLWTGAALRMYSERGEVLASIPLPVPPIEPNGDVDLPAPDHGNWSVASGTVAMARLVNREGLPIHLGVNRKRRTEKTFTVSGPDGRPLRITKGAVVEFTWHPGSERLSING